jgi:rhodanese-related sulfurtransferase
MTRLHRALALLAATLAGTALLVEIESPAGAATSHSASPGPGDYISAPDLADRIVGQDAALRVIDLRSRQDFDQLHVPGATHATLDDLRRLAIPPSARIVLYADDEDRAVRGVRLLRTRGYQDVVMLREGIYAWISRVLEPRLARDATASERAEFDRAAQLSRFFGGMPLSDVSRSELAGASTREFTRQAIAGIRRRGC